MSRMDPGRYHPPMTGDPINRSGCADATALAEKVRLLEADLRERDAQVRSLHAELRRLQQFVPRDVIKGRKRPTRAEKMNGSAPCP